ncbi:MAG: methyltransferase domain-containing protein [Betaproteobacteria bacterium]|nr:methyltransferase domain-containing protein [Betaproteobacteria bacterium]
MTPNDPAAPDATDRDSVTASIKASYEAIRYRSRPCPTSAPAHVATIARLMGLDAPDPSTARVLEIGCGDGGNLVPMAAAAPQGRYVGIDLSPGAIAEARAMASDLALSNVELDAADLRDLPSGLGTFDYIIAHGFYSWVPADVREVLLGTLRRCLSPDGIAFVSHNTMPGCALRGITWSLLRPHVAGIGDPARRVAETRSMAALMADAMADQPGLAAALAGEFRDVANRHEFLVLHDDIAVVNHPVLLREIVAEAEAHGLAWLADADVYRHPAPAYGEKMNAWLAATDRLTREHVIDHLRLRRYRESLFVHRAKGLGMPLASERLANLHVGASNTTAERHGSAPRAQVGGDRKPVGLQRMLLERLAAVHPASVPVQEAVSWITSHSSAGSTLAAPANALRLLLNACLVGAIVPFAWPVRVALEAGAVPRASAVARWQASRRDFVVNLRHDSVVFDDPVRRRLLPLVDGTRTRDALALELAAIAPEAADPRRLVNEHLAHFARIGVLEA